MCIFLSECFSVVMRFLIRLWVSGCGGLMFCCFSVIVVVFDWLI